MLSNTSGGKKKPELPVLGSESHQSGGAVSYSALNTP